MTTQRARFFVKFNGLAFPPGSTPSFRARARPDSDPHQSRDNADSELSNCKPCSPICANRLPGRPESAPAQPFPPLTMLREARASQGRAAKELGGDAHMCTSRPDVEVGDRNEALRVPEGRQARPHGWRDRMGAQPGLARGHCHPAIGAEATNDQAAATV